MKKAVEQEFQKVLPLYLQGRMDFPLIRAVVDRIHIGHIWVDNGVSPQNAFIKNKFGFAFLIGNGKNRDFNNHLYNLIFTDSSFDCKYLLWYDPPPVWQEKMSEMVAPNIRKRERIQFVFNKERFTKCTFFKNALPEGYAIKKVNAALLSKLKCFNLDLENRFWNSADDFLENSFAFCVVDEKGNPTSICYAAVITNNKAEIDVATLEQFRGKRHATIAVIAFIEFCLKKNIYPNWDCFITNKPSYKLAKTLGFEEKTSYQFYSIYRNFIGDPHHS